MSARAQDVDYAARTMRNVAHAVGIPGAARWEVHHEHGRYALVTEAVLTGARGTVAELGRTRREAVQTLAAMQAAFRLVRIYADN